MQFALQIADQTAHQAAIPVNRSNEHGLFGIFSDHAFWIADANFWQERGFFVEVIGHRGKAGRDDPTRVVARTIDHIEGDGGAEINDEGWRAEKSFDCESVGEAVWTDGSRSRIIDADAAQGARVQFEKVEF